MSQNDEIWAKLKTHPLISNNPDFLKRVDDTKTLYDNAKFYYGALQFQASLVSYSCCAISLQWILNVLKTSTLQGVSSSTQNRPNDTKYTMVNGSIDEKDDESNQLQVLPVTAGATSSTTQTLSADTRRLSSPSPVPQIQLKRANSSPSPAQQVQIPIVVFEIFKLQTDVEHFLDCCLNAIEVLQQKVKNVPVGKEENDEEKNEEDKWDKICTKINPLVFAKGSSDCLFFNDVIGLEKEKQIIKSSFIYPLSYPNLYPKASKGILIYGPPGTGKTYIIKAAVNQLQAEDPSVGVLYFAPSPGDLKGKYVGETEKKIEEIFTCAAKAACKYQEETCKDKGKKYISIIFMDEMDAIAPDRSKDTTGLAANSVNTLLQMMDGIKSSPNVAVVAATNYPWNLDSAILRRFDTQILFDVPTRNDLKKLLDFNMKDIINLDKRKVSNFCEKKKVDQSHSCNLQCETKLVKDLTGEAPYDKLSFDYFSEENKKTIEEIVNKIASEKFSNSDVSRLIKSAATNAGELSVKNNLFYNLTLIGDYKGPHKELLVSSLTSLKDKMKMIDTSISLLNNFWKGETLPKEYFQINKPKLIYVENGGYLYFNIKCLLLKNPAFVLNSPSVNDVYIKVCLKPDFNAAGDRPSLVISREEYAKNVLSASINKSNKLVYEESFIIDFIVTAYTVFETSTLSNQDFLFSSPKSLIKCCNSVIKIIDNVRSEYIKNYNPEYVDSNNTFIDKDFKYNYFNTIRLDPTSSNENQLFIQSMQNLNDLIYFNTSEDYGQPGQGEYPVAPQGSKLIGSFKNLDNFFYNTIEMPYINTHHRTKNMSDLLNLVDNSISSEFEDLTKHNFSYFLYNLLINNSVPINSIFYRDVMVDYVEKYNILKLEPAFTKRLLDDKVFTFNPEFEYFEKDDNFYVSHKQIYALFIKELGHLQDSDIKLFEDIPERIQNDNSIWVIPKQIVYILIKNKSEIKSDFITEYMAKVTTTAKLEQLIFTILVNHFKNYQNIEVSLRKQTITGTPIENAMRNLNKIKNYLNLLKVISNNKYTRSDDGSREIDLINDRNTRFENIFNKNLTTERYKKYKKEYEETILCEDNIKEKQRTKELLNAENLSIKLFKMLDISSALIYDLFYPEREEFTLMNFTNNYIHLQSPMPDEFLYTFINNDIRFFENNLGEDEEDIFVDASGGPPGAAGVPLAVAATDAVLPAAAAASRQGVKLKLRNDIKHKLVSTFGVTRRNRDQLRQVENKIKFTKEYSLYFSLAILDKPKTELPGNKITKEIFMKVSTNLSKLKDTRDKANVITTIGNTFYNILPAIKDIVNFVYNWFSSSYSSSDANSEETFKKWIDQINGMNKSNNTLSVIVKNISEIGFLYKNNDDDRYKNDEDCDIIKWANVNPLNSISSKNWNIFRLLYWIFQSLIKNIPLSTFDVTSYAWSFGGSIMNFLKYILNWILPASILSYFFPTIIGTSITGAISYIPLYIGLAINGLISSIIGLISLPYIPIALGVGTILSLAYAIYDFMRDPKLKTPAEVINDLYLENLFNNITMDSIKVTSFTNSDSDPLNSFINSLDKGYGPVMAVLSLFIGRYSGVPVGSIVPYSPYSSFLIQYENNDNLLNKETKSRLTNLNIPLASFYYALTLVKSTYDKEQGTNLIEYNEDRDKLLRKLEAAKKK
jgi:hypothetical protein